MKHLILIRHAEAEHHRFGKNDIERPLSEHGRREALATGAALVRHGVRPELMVSSTAARAAATARLIGEVLKLTDAAVIFEAVLYGASAETLEQAISAFPDTCQCIALVGHNPGLSDLANLLSGNGNIIMKTGHALRIDLAADTWRRAIHHRGTAVLLNKD